MEMKSESAGNGGRDTAPPATVLDLLVTRTFAVDVDALRSRKRGSARAAFARQVAIYLSCTRLNLTLTETGHLFGRDRTTVAHACRVIEGLRDDPVLDATVAMLERALGVRPRLRTRHRRSSAAR